MAKKYYPAIVNNNINIFTTWSDCEKFVKGVGGAKFKGCNTVAEIIEFLKDKENLSQKEISEILNKNKISFTTGDFEKTPNNINAPSSNAPVKMQKIQLNYPQNCIHVYTDGSFDKDTSTYAYGFCVVKEGQVVYEENGFGNNPKEAELWQVAGEIMGVEKAIEWAINQGEFEVVIFHDYEGVAKWTKSKEDGGWRAKTARTIEYQNKFKNYQNMINIYFVWVKAHQNSKNSIHSEYNNRADKLARQALGKN